jgi:periplasmic protein TonB
MQRSSGIDMRGSLILRKYGWMAILALAGAAPQGMAATGSLVAQDDGGDPVPPRPVGSPGDWIGADDYPRNALQSGETGIVHFALQIGIDGAPIACEVAASSGSADLDHATCALMMQRARFSPAHDAKGRPVIGRYANLVRWDLPDRVSPHFETGPYRVDYDVAADGMVEHCVLNLPAVPGVFDPCIALGQVVPYTDEQGRPVARHVTMTLAVTTRATP